MADINLIPQDERDSVRAESVQKRLQLSSIGFLIFTAVLTVITLSLFAMFASKKSALIADVEEHSARINTLKAQEELVVVAKDKATAADKLVTGRVEFSDVFEKFATLIPQGIYFTDVRVTLGKIVISGRARTSSDVASLASSLVSARGAEIVSDVSIDSLSSDENGVYAFVLSAKLVSQQAPAAGASGAADESESLPPGVAQ